MTRRDRTVLILVGAAALVAAFWFLALSPKRQEASRLGDQLTQERQELETAQSEVAASRGARSQYAANYSAVAQLGKAVPADDDVPALVYQLSSTAATSGVDFRTIKLAAAPAGAPAPAPAAQGGSQQSGGQKGAQGQPAGGGSAPAGAGSPAAPTQAATANLPPGAVVGPAGLSTMPFSFGFEGSFFHLADFFGRLERYISPTRGGLAVNGRLLVINGLSLTASNRGFPHMKASVAATTYLLPASQGQPGGAPGGASATAGAQPASSGPAPATGSATATPPTP
jgi:hypothetical protein